MRTHALWAVLVIPAFTFAIGQTALTPACAQSAPVQADQTPQQADQARAQDRKRAEDTKIDRDWKAQESDRGNGGNADNDRSNETVGRDWRAHPKDQDR